MKIIVTTCMVVLTAALGLTAQESRKSNGVAGAWEVVIKGPAAHGDLTAAMELRQDGTKVTGSFVAHGNTHTLAGEFSKGELALQTTDTDADHSMTLNAKLAADGTLAGYLSSSRGDMAWTASRVKTQR
jgi:hypothetical protein